MGKRLIITENDRKHINELYGLITESGLKILINQNKKAFMSDIEAALNLNAIPEMVRLFNQNAKIDDTLPSIASTYTYGASVKITRASVKITNLVAQDDKEDGTVDVNVSGTLLLRGVANGYFGKSVLEETPIDFTGTRLNATVKLDYKCGKKDEEDDRNLSVESFNVEIKSEQVSLKLRDGNESEEFLTAIMGSIKDRNNMLIVVVPEFSIQKVKDLNGVNTLIDNYIQGNKESLTYKFTDYPEVIKQIPFIPVEC